MQQLCTKIEELNISQKIKKILKDNKIITASDLCSYSRLELMELGIKNSGITEITISLQLLGLDIKPKYKSVKK